MSGYDLGKLSGRKGGSTVLPPLEERTGTVLAYQRALRVLVRGMATEVRASVIPAYRADRMTSDAVGTDAFASLRSLSTVLVGAAEAMARRLIRAEASRHTDQWRRDAKAAMGIDLAAVVREEDTDGLVEAMIARNSALITSLSEDVLNRVTRVVTDYSLNGASVRSLRKKLTEELSITDRRAKIIARDQIAKANADLNRFRHEQAGVKSYRWTTSRDERVRPLHASLDGKVYKMKEETGAEGGLPPGKPVLCRCIARAIVEY